MRRPMVCSLALLLGACASSGGRMTESIGIANAGIRTGNEGSTTLQDVQITTRPGLSTAAR